MSTVSGFYSGGGKPKLVTTYTTGSGTYTPVAANSWCFVTLVGGGGAGGQASGCSGTYYSDTGSPGRWLRQWTKVVSTASYSVGAGGYYYWDGSSWVIASAGSTTFNGLSAAGGPSGSGSDATSYNISRLTFRAGWYGHGSTYGLPGGGAIAFAGGGCSTQNGGNGTAGVIIIEDFGQ